jgi:hypothetical protein
MTLAWQTELRQTEKLVLLALADNANDEGQCFPAVATLMSRCCMTDRGVQKVIGALVHLGHLTQHFRPGKSTVYIVHPRTTVHPEQRFTPERQFAPPPNGGSPPPPNGSSPPEKKKTSSLEPSVESSLNHHGAVNGAKKSARAESEEPPPSNLNVEAWHRWEQYRREIRRPIKPVSVPAAQRKLAGFGADQGAVVEQSIANGWQGLFDLGRKATASRGFDTADEWRPSE